MPATNEEFIKKAFEAGLSEDQVRQAVSARNAALAKIQQPQMTKEQALAKQVPVQGSMEYKPNPILETAAKAQEFLGNSEVLPTIGAVATRAAIPIPGVSSFLGATIGERAKQSLNEGGPLAALKMAIPGFESNPEVNKNILKTGAVAGATDLALTGAGKVAGKVANSGMEYIKNMIGAKSINPWKVTEYASNMASKNAPNLTSEQGVNIGNKIMEVAKKAPAPFREDAVKNAQVYIDDLKNGKSISDVLFSKRASQGVGYLQKSGAEVRGADAWLEREVAKILNNSLEEFAPKVRSAEKTFEFLHGASKEVPAAIKRFGPAALLGKLIGGQ